jgi:hypothetical protein
MMDKPKPRITLNLPDDDMPDYLIGEWTCRHADYSRLGDGSTPLEAYIDWVYSNATQLTVFLAHRSSDGVQKCQ